MTIRRRTLLTPLAALALACSGDDASTTTATTSATDASTSTTTDTTTTTTTDATTTTTTTDATATTTAGETTTTTADETTTTTTTTTDTTTGGADLVVVEGFSHPESALWVGMEMRWYISNIGGDPSAKDGDGFISRLAADGTITTVVGDGVEGDQGDGGPATEARLYRPSDVAIGPHGDLFIADTWNSLIRKVDKETGIITTTSSGAVLPIDLETTSVMLLAFPPMLLLWKAVQDDGQVSWVETAAMICVFGIVVYLLAAHG